MKSISLTFLLITLFFNFKAHAQNIESLLEKGPSYLEKKPLPVDQAFGLPWYWNNYQGGVSSFQKEIYNQILGTKSPTEILEEIIKANSFDQRIKDKTTVHKFKIVGGYLYLVFDFYYITTDEKGELVSFFIEGEEQGQYPAGQNHIYQSDDLLCFFKGPHQGSCAVADDT